MRVRSGYQGFARRLLSLIAVGGLVSFAAHAQYDFQEDDHATPPPAPTEQTVADPKKPTPKPSPTKPAVSSGAATDPALPGDDLPPDLVAPSTPQPTPAPAPQTPVTPVEEVPPISTEEATIVAPAPLDDTKPRVVTRIRTPLKFREEAQESAVLPGRTKIFFDFPASEYDLDSRIWKVGPSYNLDSVIDVRNANQEILPTDEFGRLTPAAKALYTRPFIKYYLPDGTTKIIDLTCTKKQCRGLWKKFPYKGQMTVFKVEVNVRGLQGKNWTLLFNQLMPERGVVRVVPELVKLSGANRYEKIRDYERNSYTPPGRSAPVEPDFIERWIFDAKKGNFASGYHRVDRATLIEVYKGLIVLDLTKGKISMESIELRPGDRIWLDAGTILAVKAPQGGLIRRLEFNPGP